MFPQPVGSVSLIVGVGISVSLKEETWFGNTAECCLNVTTSKVNENRMLDTCCSETEIPFLSGGCWSKIPTLAGILDTDYGLRVVFLAS